MCLPFYWGGFRDTNTGCWTASAIAARAAPRGQSVDLLGIYVVTPGAQWSALNRAFISEPVTDLARLRERIERAAAFYRARKRDWTLVVCEEWIAPELRAAVAPLCAELSLTYTSQSVGMTGASFPAPPPTALEIRPVTDAATRHDLALVNARAWGIPLQWTEELLNPSAFWEIARAYVAYADGEAVSTAMHYPAQGSHYLAWFATHPDHRRKGYADAVVRHAAAECPSSFLVASPMGVKIWERIGFRAVTHFAHYISAGKTD